ncbi:MAG: HAD family hydrolase [Firmicutes bacterium]|nr:HAD family hydrolase [Bacillota bacterium]
MPNLLFDYDGTLHDSMKIYAPSVQLAWDRLAAKGLTEPRTLSEEELRPCIGMTPDEMWGYFAMNIGEEEKRECTKLVGDNMLELVRRGEAKLYDGVPEALAELRRRGFHLVLLSNCPVSYLEAHTEQFHLEQYFEGLYCAEEFGYRPKYEIFERLRGHYPGPFAVVGDRRHDMEAAQRGGVPLRAGRGNRFAERRKRVDDPAQNIAHIDAFIPEQQQRGRRKQQHRRNGEHELPPEAGLYPPFAFDTFRQRHFAAPFPKHIILMR